jgi:hypothetical protein
MPTPNTTFSSGAVLTAEQVNSLPFGLCGLQTLTTAFGTAAAHTTYQDTGATLTITEISGRRYKITMLANPYPNGGLQGVRFKLLRAGVGLRENHYSSTVMDTGVALAVVIQFVYTSVSSGSATYKMQMAALSANTQVSDFGDASFPRQFMIEDLGKS